MSRRVRQRLREIEKKRTDDPEKGTGREKEREILAGWRVGGGRPQSQTAPDTCPSTHTTPRTTILLTMTHIIRSIHPKLAVHTLPHQALFILILYTMATPLRDIGGSFVNGKEREVLTERGRSHMGGMISIRGVRRVIIAQSDERQAVRKNARP